MSHTNTCTIHLDKTLSITKTSLGTKYQNNIHINNLNSYLKLKSWSKMFQWPKRSAKHVLYNLGFWGWGVVFWGLQPITTQNIIPNPSTLYLSNVDFQPSFRKIPRKPERSSTHFPSNCLLKLVIGHQSHNQTVR